MARLFGAGAGNPFAGPSGGFYAAAPAGNPFADASKTFDRSLMEQDSGAPALGFYATASGANDPFKTWLESYATHHQLWSDYQGQYAARNDPSFGFTDYLRESDPYARYMQLSQQDRGEAPATALAPFTQLMSL